MNIEVKWEPRDLWVGIYWDVMKVISTNYELKDSHYIILKIYICLIPCFPIMISKKLK